MGELHRHYQCDNCSGIDCGQDDPERYLEQQFHDEETRDKRIRNETLDEVYKRLHFMVTDPMRRSPILTSDNIECLFAELREIKGDKVK